MKPQNEKLTIQFSETLYTFIDNVEQSDNASTLATQTNELAQAALTVLCKQYEKLQNGKSKNKTPAPGEMPFNMALMVIDRLYDAHERKCTRESFQDRQVKMLKQALIDKVLPKKVAVLTANQLITKYEKELKAAQEIAAKAIKDAQAAQEKATQAAQTKATKDAQAAQAVKEAAISGHTDIVTDKIVETIQAGKVVKEADKAVKDTQAAQEKAQAQVNKAQTKLDNAKEKLNAPKPASAGKADNNQQDPKLDFMTMNFSKDCKDEAARMLAEIEDDYKPSKPEMLMLAKLILDKYNN